MVGAGEGSVCSVLGNSATSGPYKDSRGREERRNGRQGGREKTENEK